MGQFFTSPQEAGATSLFDMAMGGKTPWDSLINEKAGMAKTQVGQQASSAIGQGGQDIFSQLASMGVAPGSGQTDIANKNATGIRSGAINTNANIDMAALGDQLQYLFGMMQTGLGGMSTSSSFGDILAALTSGANIFSGGAKGLSLLGNGLGGNRGTDEGWMH